MGRNVQRSFHIKRYIVVWQDDRSTSTVFDICGQRVSSTGDLLDNNFAISTGQDQQQYPVVAYNTDANQYLVIWQDSRPGTVTPVSTNWCIYGQVISGTGELIDPAGTPGPSDPSVNLPIAEKAEAQCYPSVSYSSNAHGEYLVVWQEDIGDTVSRIYGQRLRGSRPRIPMGSQFPIPTYTPNDQEFPAIAYNSCRDEYLVVWQEYRTRDGTRWDIYGQRISGHYQGSPYKDGSFAICSAGDDQVSPSVAYNNTAREYSVVWQDGPSFNPDRSIYGQRVSETGDLLGSNFVISLAPTDCNRHPSVAYNSSANEYLVVWQGYLAKSYKWAVYGQWISEEGKLKGENSRLSIESNVTPLPDVGYSDSAKKYLVVWSHEGNIYGQLVGPGPTPTMTPTRVPPYVEFNKECYYTTSDIATITVVDPDLNHDSNKQETIDIEVINDYCPLVCIRLEENGPNSGVFTSDLYFCFSNDPNCKCDSNCESRSDTIKVTNGKKIIAKYRVGGSLWTDEATWYEVAPTPTPTCIASWMSIVETPRPSNTAFPTPTPTATSTATPSRGG